MHVRNVRIGILSVERAEHGMARHGTAWHDMSCSNGMIVVVVVAAAVVAVPQLFL